VLNIGKSFTEIHKMMHDKWLNSDKHFWFWFQSLDSIPLPTKMYQGIQLSNGIHPQKLSRRQDIAITRTRIEHAFLTHSYLITKDLPPICNVCHTTITIEHTFEERPWHEPIRATFNLPQNIKEDQATKIIDFITKCNLLNKM